MQEYVVFKDGRFLKNNRRSFCQHYSEAMIFSDHYESVRMAIMVSGVVLNDGMFIKEDKQA